MLGTRGGGVDEDDDTALTRARALSRSRSSGREGRAEVLTELLAELERAESDFDDRLDLADSDLERRTGRGVAHIMAAISGLVAPSRSLPRPPFVRPRTASIAPSAIEAE